MKKNTKYYLLTIFAPLIGILFMFSMAFMYVGAEKKSIENKIDGINLVAQVQSLFIDLQKQSINYKYLKDKTKIDELDKKIVEDLNELKDSISLKPINSLYLKQLVEDTSDHLSKDLHKEIVIDEKFFDSFIYILYFISFDSKLVSDSYQDVYLFMKILTDKLPSLNTSNNNIKNSVVNGIDNKKIDVELSKIDDILKSIDLDVSLTKSNNQVLVLKAVYDNMNRSFQSTKTFFDEKYDSSKLENFIYLVQNNINFIDLMYKKTIETLKKELDESIQDKTNIQLVIIFVALASILFILFINYKFHQKNNKLIQVMKENSVTDSMTNISNRRFFDEIFKRYIQSHRRNRTNFVFIILDIDHFKQYNDTYGHKAGDDALQAVAKSLKDTLKRADDMVFRLGGEEFGILCGEMDKKKAEIFSNKIRMNIENLQIEHSRNSASAYLTISLGVIVVEPHFNYEDEAIYKFADDVLYEAKRKGRNQACIFNNFNKES